jgi:hypothetical protein
MIDLIALLVIGLIIVGCAVYLYQKGTFVKAFAMAIAAVCASSIALGFFNILANTLVSFSSNSDLLVKWGPLICFVLLFIVAFAVLQTIINLINRRPIDLGFLPEHIGRAACGAFLGFTLSRVLFAVLIMSSLPGLQTSAMGKYLSYEGINPPKKTQQTKAAKPSDQRESGAKKESKRTPEKKKLSDTSKSILGPEFE